MVPNVARVSSLPSSLVPVGSLEADVHTVSLHVDLNL